MRLPFPPQLNTPLLKLANKIGFAFLITFYSDFYFSHQNREIYLVAADSIDSLRKSLDSEITILGTFEGKMLEEVFYQPCLPLNIALPLLSSKHVESGKGTGLVHSAFAHGFEDFEVVGINILRNKLPVFILSQINKRF